MQFNFLVNVFKLGQGYSAINTARSALSSIFKPRHGVTFGEEPFIKRLLQGMFNISVADLGSRGISKRLRLVTVQWFIQLSRGHRPYTSTKRMEGINPLRAHLSHG